MERALGIGIGICVAVLTVAGGRALAQGQWAPPAPPPQGPPPPMVIAPPPPPRVHSINGSPLGLLAGTYALNYERLFDGTHGLMMEGSFGYSSSSATDSRSTSSNFGVGAGYRWHWSGTQDSGFLGLMAGYSRGTGRVTITSGMTSEVFDLSVGAPWLVANIGRRWAWDNGLNITFRIGGGWADYKVTTSSTDPEAQEAVDLLQDLLELFPIALDGELSLGYAF